jgi:hypothetical protein
MSFFDSTCVEIDQRVARDIMAIYVVCQWSQNVPFWKLVCAAYCKRLATSVSIALRASEIPTVDTTGFVVLVSVKVSRWTSVSIAAAFFCTTLMEFRLCAIRIRTLELVCIAPVEKVCWTLIQEATAIFHATPFII